MLEPEQERTAEEQSREKATAGEEQEPQEGSGKSFGRSQQAP